MQNMSVGLCDLRLHLFLLEICLAVHGRKQSKLQSRLPLHFASRSANSNARAAQPDEALCIAVSTVCISSCMAATSMNVHHLFPLIDFGLGSRSPGGQECAKRQSGFYKRPCLAQPPISRPGLRSSLCTMCWMSLPSTSLRYATCTQPISLSVCSTEAGQLLLCASLVTLVMLLNQKVQRCESIGIFSLHECTACGVRRISGMLKWSCCIPAHQPQRQGAHLTCQPSLLLQGRCWNVSVLRKLLTANMDPQALNDASWSELCEFLSCVVQG